MVIVYKEPQNIRVGRDPHISSSPTPGSIQDHPKTNQMSESVVQTLLELQQLSALTTVRGSLSQSPTTPWVQNLSLMQLNVFCLFVCFLWEWALWSISISDLVCMREFLQCMFAPCLYCNVLVCPWPAGINVQAVHKGTFLCAPPAMSTAVPPALAPYMFAVHI